MTKWTPAVYDRTAQDLVDRTAKAFLNIADWMRLSGNTEYVAAFIRVMTGLNVPLDPVITPTVTHFPSADELNALIGNIDALREAAYLPAGTGIVPLKHDYTAGAGGQSPNYEAVNAWERDLQLVRDCLAAASDYLVYAGVAAVGQPRSWQNQFRRWEWVPDAASPVRRPRTGIAVAGAGYTRQNEFRRYE